MVSPDGSDSPDGQPHVFQRHGRRFEDNRYVYPVVSRRSRGLSIGVNLNPDKVCNFDCIYCQVDRRSESEVRFVDTDGLMDELRSVLELSVSGAVFASDRLRDTPEHLRRLNDIAFSGDGEPTTFLNFDEIIGRAAELRQEIAPPETEMVLITNASMFHREHVRRGLAILDANNGNIWAKLDAGTAEYYHLIERTKIPFQRILDNITAAARVRPVTIQSLFMNVAGEPPSTVEIDAYCDRLNEITAAGGTIQWVQIYTVARPPAESFVTALTADQLENIATAVRNQCQLPVGTYV